MCSEKCFVVDPVAELDGIDGEARVSCGPRYKGYLPLKTALEWTICLVMLIVTAPLVGLIALIIKATSPGPAFYRQVRLGRNGRPFAIFKLRSMTHNCEAKTGPVWSGANDVRVTSIGRFLRDTHLDELPQVLNVLAGQMSLVGPRPERPELATRIERTLPQYRNRLRLRPGLTGLAQVQLPADADMEDVRRKLAHDLYYVRNVNLWVDLRIMACTIFHLTSLSLNSFGRLLVKSYGSAAEKSSLAEPTVFGVERQARSA